MENIMAHLCEFKDKCDQDCRKNGFFVKDDLCVELGSNNNGRLRSLFHQVLWCFFKKVSKNKDLIWGFPPKLGDGMEVDLFTLFWVVRKIGSYELVSKNDMWEYVAKECGIDVVHVAYLKVMHIKYLKDLDHWLTHGGFKDMTLDNGYGDIGVVQKLDLLFRELKGCKYSLARVGFESDEKGKCVVMGSSDNGGTEELNAILDIDNAKTETGFSRINNVDEKDEMYGGLDAEKLKFKKVVLCPKNVLSSVHSNISEHNDRNNIDNNSVKISTTIDNNVGYLKRRKEESLSLSKMLNWLAYAARNPHNVMIGCIPKSSKCQKYKGNEVWKQVLLVKQSLFAKPNVDSSNKSYVPQKKRHMMHPSMYEDDKIPVHLSSKRMRCSSQRVSLVKSCSCPGCTSCSSSRTKRVKMTPQILETFKIQDDTCEDHETESDNIRAEVPKWTGFVSESDPKWLGTLMWPSPDDKSRKHEADVGVIGKGRQCTCTCRFPDSADCVRVHISENRVKVKHTLGRLFYKWKFHRMGEEAAVSSWSLEEESEFKSLVIKARQELSDKSKSRHEIMSNFWRRASESIPFKTKGMLVSYYFNVFVLRRRRFQNRIMPKNIDSDDDEQEMDQEKIDSLPIKCSKNLES